MTPCRIKVAGLQGQGKPVVTSRLNSWPEGPTRPDGTAQKVARAQSGSTMPFYCSLTVCTPCQQPAVLVGPWKLSP